MKEKLIEYLKGKIKFAKYWKMEHLHQFNVTLEEAEYILKSLEKEE